MTLADDYSGVYHSQVLDVCRYLRQWLGIPTRLIALVPLRTYRRTRAKIIEIIPDALVLPMWPSRFNWQRNLLFIFFLRKKFKNEIVICRGVLATNLAINYKKKGYIKKIVYDARGATAAEWSEYLHHENESLNNEIKHLERKALMNADFCMSVSQSLVEYWQSDFSYRTNNNVVIPTTLSESFLEPIMNKEKRSGLRHKMGFQPNDIVLAYSGSAAGWQSFPLLKEEATRFLEADSRVKILFITDTPGFLSTLAIDYPGRVVIKSCNHQQVFNLLNVADYGLLIREDSITNRVSAPTKFAEYLAAGCSIIIKGRVGDYNKFLKENNCGVTLSDMEKKLCPISVQQREHNNFLAHQYFCKYSNYIESKYRYLISQIMK